jgi:hypothetical protein
MRQPTISPALILGSARAASLVLLPVMRRGWVPLSLESDDPAESHDVCESALRAATPGHDQAARESDKEHSEIFPISARRRGRPR